MTKKVLAVERPRILATRVTHNGSPLAAILGSSTAAIAEMGLFHPVDTVAKRLMSNTSKIFVTEGASTGHGAIKVQSGFSASMTNLNNVIFRKAANEGILAKWGSLFPGVGFGFSYKILQRVYKFGGQPFVKARLNNSPFGEFMRTNFGDKTGGALVSAFSGSLIGIGEVALLPLDALKIKAQTNPEQLSGRGVSDLFRNEGFALYRGWQWTMARNAPGSFALFGGAAFVKNMLDVDEKNATFLQHALASVGGATASITVAQPLDVIKTRIQARPFDSPETGTEIIKKLIKNEGFGAFFKGLTPKLAVVGPKLIFSFTIAQQTIQYFQNRMDNNGGSLF